MEYLCKAGEIKVAHLLTILVDRRQAKTIAEAGCIIVKAMPDHFQSCNDQWILQGYFIVNFSEFALENR